MEMKEEGKLVVRGRAEIDTRAPFNSVKEAVLLFGETVLANGIYALKLQQSNAKENHEAREDRESEPKMEERDETTTRELEETKMELERAREEAEKMGKTMLSLKQELEQTKSQLQWLKAKELMLSQNHQIRVQHPQQTEAKMMKVNSTNTVQDEDDEGIGKKRTVKFASPPTLTKVISTKEEKTKNKNKNKSLVPIIRWFISKKKGNKQTQSSP